MKKWLILLAAAALLLAGCGEVAETVPTTEVPPTAEPTLPPVTCYVADSATERATDGKVRQFAMEGTVEGFARMGDNLLMYTDDQRLSLLGGEDLQILGSRKLDNPLDWDNCGLVISEDRVAWFDHLAGAYVILSEDLSLQSQIQVKGTITAGPVMASDFNTVYYAEGTGIRALDLSTGVSRMLRQESTEVVSIDGVIFGDSVLRYIRRLSDGSLQTCFVDSHDGSAFHTADFQGQLVSWEGNYAGVLSNDYPMGTIDRVVCGDLEGSLQVLETAQGWEEILFAGQGRVVFQIMDKLGLHLRCYDLTAGSLEAEVTMPLRESFFTMGCVDGSRIWLGDGNDGKFFCWDLELTPPQGPDGELVPYHSLGDPDRAGMELVRERARKLGEQLGWVISFENGNNRTTGVDYSGYMDHQVIMYSAALDKLEAAVAKLPEWLPDRMAQCTEEDRLEIVLVDDFDPARPYAGGEGDMSMEGGQATVWVSMAADLEQLLYHQLFHVAEVRIQNTRDGFSDWEEMNPEDFIYAGEDAYASGRLKDSPYLTFGDNYFADDYGMVSPREDRAQIFVWAMTEGQEARFASEAMQAKLERICYLLRKAYWVDLGEKLLWEQYLLPEE